MIHFLRNSTWLNRVLARPHGADWLCVAFLLCLPPVLFWRATLGLVTLGGGDTLSWFFPQFAQAAAMLKQGELPLWNAQMYGGKPLFAEPQLGLLNPLNWIYYFSATGWAMTIAHQLTFAIALLGGFVYARSLHWRRCAALVTAIVYALSGFLVARVIYPALPQVVALTPFVLFFLEQLYQRSGLGAGLAAGSVTNSAARWRAVAGGAFIVAWQLLAGHPQPFAYCALLAGAYALFCATLRNDSWRTDDGRTGLRARVTFLAQASLFYLGGAALAAVQLIPTWELANQSVRARLPFAVFAQNSLHPVSLLGTLFPFLHGAHGGSGLFKLEYWGTYWHHGEAQLYLGALALALALAGAWLSVRLRFSVGLFWVTAGLSAALLSFGFFLEPLARVVYAAPLIGNFRSANRWWMIAVFAVAVLAGYAVNALQESTAEHARRIARLSGPVIVLLTLVVSATVLTRPLAVEQAIRALPYLNFLAPGFLQHAGLAYALPPLLALLAWLVCWLVTRQPQQRAHWLVLCLLCDYGFYLANAPNTLAERPEKTLATQRIDNLPVSANPLEPFRHHFIIAPWTQTLLNPLTYFAGYEMAGGFSPLVSARYRELVGVNGDGGTERTAILNPHDTTLDLLNVRYVLALANVALPNEPDPVQFGGVSFKRLPLAVELRANEAASFATQDAGQGGDTLALVAMLANAGELATGELVAEATVRCGAQAPVTLPIRAGNEVSEWAYDRPDVKASSKHERARIAESWAANENGNAYEGHNYLALLKLPQQCAGAAAVRLTGRMRTNATLNLKHLSLHDATTQRSLPLLRSLVADLQLESAASGIAESNLKTHAPGSAALPRWRDTGQRITVPNYGTLAVFENMRVLPRAWIVSAVQERAATQQLADIQAGTSAGFNPRQTALLEPAALAVSDRELIQPPLPGNPHGVSPATILERSARRLLIEANITDAKRLLVLSEMAYPGWQARVDGQPVEWQRVNYFLCGIPLTPGKHRVEFVYRPQSLMLGAGISAVSWLVWLCALGWQRRRQRNAVNASAPSPQFRA